MERPNWQTFREGLVAWWSPDRLISTVAAPAAAALLGGGAVLQILVAGACLPRTHLSEGQIQCYVTVACLGSMAIGVWVPHGLVARVLRRVSQHVVGHEYTSDDLILLRPRLASDGILRWLFIASLATISGTLYVLMIPLAWGLRALNGFLTERFLWMPITWSAVQFTLIVLMLSSPGLVLGMAVTGLGTPCFTDDRGKTPSLIPLMWLGCAVGILVWSRSETIWAGRYLAFLLVSVPFFTASILGVIAANAAERPVFKEEPSPASLPDRISSDRFVVAAGLFAWGALAVLWATLEFYTEIGQRIATHPPRAGWIVCLLPGTLAGEWWRTHRRHSRGGAGTALWAVGLASGLAAASNHITPQSLGWHFPGATASILGSAVSSVVTGFTLPYLVQCLANRYASPAFGHSLAASCLFGGAAFGLVLARTLALTGLNATHLVILPSLGAIAAGGILVIYEPDSSGKHRRIRLALIFGSIVGLMLMFRHGAGFPPAPLPL